MEFSAVPLEFIASLPPVPPNDNRVDFFETLGTTGCLLDCATEAWHGRLLRQRKFAESRRETIELNRKLHPPAERGKNLPSRDLALWRPEFTWERLAESVTNGCGSCQFVYSLLDKYFSVREIPKCEDWKFQWIGHSFHMFATEKGSTAPSHLFQLFTPSSSSTRFWGMGSANVLNGDTSSDLSFERAQRWIHDCESSHIHCGSGRKVSLPKRLVDLGPAGQDYKQLLKLTETEGLVGTYACLSHCWGKDPMPIRTLNENIAHHNQSLPWISLPKTFQDAIEIICRLGIRYLWIDSLCIIQDSTEDWQVESSKMADIYHNSYITVAAVSSSDFRGGCFSTNKVGDYCFELHAGSSEKSRDRVLVAVRDDKGIGRIAERDDLEKAFPLLTRAWVYQERLLSRRVLYCNESELQLECREERPCECDCFGLSPHPVPGLLPSRLFAHVKRQYIEAVKKSGKPGEFDRSQVCRHWQRTVVHYSKLRLTYTSDRLPALSGCAKDTGKITNHTYLAGLWRETLAEGLNWSVNGNGLCPRPADWRAPTWSWASVDTTQGVEFTYSALSRYRSDFQSKVEEAECVLAGKDTTGNVSSGFLRLRTNLRPVYLRRFCPNCHLNRSTKIKFTIEHDTWYTRAKFDTDCTSCKFDSQQDGAFQPLVTHGALLQYFPDYEPDLADRLRELPIQAKDGGKCMMAHSFLLHLYDGKPSSASPSVSDSFLVLRKAMIGDRTSPGKEARTASNTGSLEDLEAVDFVRVGLMRLTFDDGENNTKKGQRGKRNRYRSRNQGDRKDKYNDPDDDVEGNDDGGEGNNGGKEKCDSGGEDNNGEDKNESHGSKHNNGNDNRGKKDKNRTSPFSASDPYWNKRNTWFDTVYTPGCTKEIVVTII